MKRLGMLFFVLMFGLVALAGCAKSTVDIGIVLFQSAEESKQGSECWFSVPCYFEHHRV